MSDESKIRDAADAVKGIVEAVPIYQDALQPAVKEIGKGLETVAKTIHIALAPVAALVWGYDQIRDFVTTRVAEKLKAIPQERIQTPNPTVAGPALEALRYTGHDENLRELYANLLATSIDSATAATAHPAFVDIIKNMAPDEAKILRFFATAGAYPAVDLKITFKEDGGFVILRRHASLIGQDAGCQHPQFATNYLDNLSRLGLLEVPYGFFIKDEKMYEAIEKHPEVLQLKEEFAANDNVTFGIDKKKVQVTDLGKQFIRACVIDKAIETKT